MKKDYLWDPRSEPDAEVQGLEDLLGRFRCPAGSVLDEEQPARPAGQKRLRWTPLRSVLVGLAAAALVMYLLPQRERPSYEVIELGDSRWLHVGEEMVVGTGGASILIPNIGGADFDPGSIVRVDEIRAGDGSGGERHALYMKRGMMHASITAAERVFTCGTPAGLTIDLGCIYSLEVDEDGLSTLTVTAGTVAFGADAAVAGAAGDQRYEVKVPQMASCVALPGHGPLPAHFEGDSAARRALVARFAKREGTSAAQRAELLTIDHTRDMLPLFGLLTDKRVAHDLRSEIFDVLSAYVGPSKLISKDGLLSGDMETSEALFWMLRAHW